jgi:NADPH-dependent curcumin reductase CurA
MCTCTVHVYVTHYKYPKISDQVVSTLHVHSRRNIKGIVSQYETQLLLNELISSKIQLSGYREYVYGIIVHGNTRRN